MGMLGDLLGSTVATSRAPAALEESLSPQHETPWQRRGVQTIALLALAVSAGYLIWRTAGTVGTWWVGVPLLVLEVHATVGLALFAFSLWELRTTPPYGGPGRDEDELRVAVLISTYDEPEEVLLPTIAGAVALPEPHRTLVLDDGDRPWVHDLCRRLGASYVNRQDNAHAKAGNLNNALRLLGDSVDVVAVLDADHVPTERFLTETLGYFDDPNVALVQTPQDFYNAGSFEHSANRSLLWPSSRRARYNEQALFYRGIQSGKNRWNASFWCGTNALLRVEALRSVGGVATDSLTEDIHTTLRLHRVGWSTVYHNEPLAFGLAARSAAEYQLQRFRWGSGAMQLLRSDRPITGPGLTLPQRLSYAATLLGWFDAWRTLGYIVLPMATLVSGELPIRGDLLTFAVLYLATNLLQRIAMSALSRGLAPQGVAIVFEVIRLPVNLLATATVLSRGQRTFQVTPKGSSETRRTPVPPLIIALIGLDIASLAWFGATMAGRTPTAYEQQTAALVTAGFAFFNLIVLVVAARRIRSIHFARLRRRGERFAVAAYSCVLDGRPVGLADISLTGASITTGEHHPQGASKLVVELGSEEVTLPVIERSRRPISPPGTVRIGLELNRPSGQQLAVLSRALFHRQALMSEMDEPLDPRDEPVTAIGDDRRASRQQA